MLFNILKLLRLQLLLLLLLLQLQPGRYQLRLQLLLQLLLLKLKKLLISLPTLPLKLLKRMMSQLNGKTLSSKEILLSKSFISSFSSLLLLSDFCMPISKLTKKRKWKKKEKAELKEPSMEMETNLLSLISLLVKWTTQTTASIHMPEPELIKLWPKLRNKEKSNQCKISTGPEI